MLGLTGLILIALGVVFASRPDVGALTIAEVFGLFNLVWGLPRPHATANEQSRLARARLVQVAVGDDVVAEADGTAVRVERRRCG